jgi:hypothetical protein
MPFFRYIHRGVGVFLAGKRAMPEALRPEYLQIKAYAASVGFVKPELPRSEHHDYVFYFTDKGRSLFEAHYRAFFERYLEDLALEVVDEAGLPPIAYADEYQIALRVTRAAPTPRP